LALVVWGFCCPRHSSCVALDVLTKVDCVLTVVLLALNVVDTLGHPQALQDLLVGIFDLLYLANAEVSVKEGLGVTVIPGGFNGEGLRSICSIFLRRRRLCS
jgi:hypothetical protein